MLNKLIYAVSATIFGFIVYKNYQLLDGIPRDLMNAKPSWLLLAVLLQVVKYLVLSYNFHINFQKAGVGFRYWEVLKATFVYMYVCVSTPFVGAGGLLAFVQYAGHQNVSKLKVAAGSFLALLGDYLGFFIIVLFSLIVFKDTIDDFPVNYIIAMLSFGALLIGLVFSSIFMKGFLVKIFDYLRRLANYTTYLIHKKVHFDDKWAHRNVDLAHECFVDIKKDPTFYLKVILVGFTFHVLNIFTLYAVAASFSEKLNISKTVSSYVVLNILETVSPTPNGIGIIESLVPEFMSSIGIEFSSSLVIITVFRLIYFYIPLILGFYFSYRIFNGKK